MRWHRRILGFEPYGKGGFWALTSIYRLPVWTGQPALELLVQL